MDEARLSDLTYLVLHDLERPPERRRYVHGYLSSVVEQELDSLRRKGFTKMVPSDWHPGGEHVELTTEARRALVAHRMAGRSSRTTRTARSPKGGSSIPTPQAPFVNTPLYKIELAYPVDGAAAGRVRSVARDLRKLRRAIGSGTVRRGRKFGVVVVTSVSSRGVRWRAPGLTGTVKLRSAGRVR